MAASLNGANAGSNDYPSRWRVLIACFCSYGFDAMDFMMLALSLSLIAQELHLSLGEAGLLGTAGMLGVGLSSVVVGWFADNFGRKRALMICVAVFGAFTAAVFWSNGWWSVVALRFLAGLGLGGTWGVITAYVNETWPREARGRAIAFVLSSWPVGYIVAALLARQVLPTLGWRPLFLVGGVAILAVPLIAMFVPESAHWRRERASWRPGEKVAVREIFAPDLRRHTVLGTLAASCALIGYWGASTWLPTFLVRERGLSQASMAGFIIALNIGMFVGYQFFGWFADRLGQRKALLWCLVGAALLLPLYTSLQNVVQLFWLGPVLGLFFAYTGPFGAYFPTLYPTRVRSLGAGFCFDVGRGVAALAPYGFGELASRVGLARSIGFCGLGFLLSAIVMWKMPDSRQGDTIEPLGQSAGR